MVFNVLLPILIYGLKIENRRSLIIAFDEAKIGNFPILETLQIVPCWTSFNLNNGFKLNLLTSIKGIENYSFI